MPVITINNTLAANIDKVLSGPKAVTVHQGLYDARSLLTTVQSLIRAAERGCDYCTIVGGIHPGCPVHGRLLDASADSTPADVCVVECGLAGHSRDHAPGVDSAGTRSLDPDAHDWDFAADIERDNR